MKRATQIILILALTCAVASGQRRSAQSSFSAEGEVARPVRLSADVISQVLEVEKERACAAGMSQTEAARQLVGSEIDVNGDSFSDLIVKANSGCFMGAHATTFWVFTKVETRLASGYDLALSTMADFLRVRAARTNGYRDIETSYATALELYSTVWKFDGSKYEPRECAIEEFQTKRRQRVRCEEREEN